MTFNVNRATIYLCVAIIGVCTMNSYALTPIDSLKLKVTTLENTLAIVSARLDKLENKQEPIKSSPSPQATVQTTPTVASIPLTPLTPLTLSPLSLTLVKKSVEAITDGPTAQRQINLMLLFKNKSEKDISSISGNVHFFDVTRKELITFELTLDQLFSRGKESSWLGALDAVPALGNVNGFLNLENASIIAEYRPKRIAYTDGSQQIYDTK